MIPYCLNDFFLLFENGKIQVKCRFGSTRFPQRPLLDGGLYALLKPVNPIFKFAAGFPESLNATDFSPDRISIHQSGAAEFRLDFSYGIRMFFQTLLPIKRFRSFYSRKPVFAKGFAAAGLTQTGADKYLADPPSQNAIA